MSCGEQPSARDERRIAKSPDYNDGGKASSQVCVARIRNIVTCDDCRRHQQQRNKERMHIGFDANREVTVYAGIPFSASQTASTAVNRGVNPRTRSAFAMLAHGECIM